MSSLADDSLNEIGSTDICFSFSAHSALSGEYVETMNSSFPEMDLELLKLPDVGNAGAIAGEICG